MFISGLGWSQAVKSSLKYGFLVLLVDVVKMAPDDQIVYSHGDFWLFLLLQAHCLCV